MSITLDILPDDLRNCVIKDRESGLELYTVHSAHPRTGTTTITQTAEKKLLATVHYHDMPVIPDTIKLADHGGKISVRKWLKPATIVHSL